MFSHKLNRVNVSKNALQEWGMYNAPKVKRWLNIISFSLK